jgi:tetratricopeptide (TPR) repeat protein
MGALYRDALKTLTLGGFAIIVGLGDARAPAPVHPPGRPEPAGVAACNEAAHGQSIVDERIVASVQSAFNREGFAAVLARMPEMKAVVARAPRALPRYEWCDDKVVIISSTLDDYFTAQARYARFATEWRPSSYAQAAILTGGALLQAGRFAEAAPILQTAIALQPANSGLAGEAVVALNMTGRLAEGIALAQTTLSRNLDMADTERAHLLRAEGYAYGELGDFDRAESAYQMSLGLEPGNRTALKEMGYIARRRAGAGSAPVRPVITQQAPGKP